LEAKDEPSEEVGDLHEDGLERPKRTELGDYPEDDMPSLVKPKPKRPSGTSKPRGPRKSTAAVKRVQTLDNGNG
jgi:hypothetical protein